MGVCEIHKLLSTDPCRQIKRRANSYAVLGPSTVYQLCSIGCSRMMCSGQTESQGYESWCRGYDKLVVQRRR